MKTIYSTLMAIGLSCTTLAWGNETLSPQKADSATAASEVIDVYKNPNCGCCGKWVEHMQKAGFKVRMHELSNVSPMRQKLGMPERYASCHTAKVGNYLLEGHVPAADVKRLLREKPKAIGLAVPGMPAGSPGMEGPPPASYNTLLVKSDANSLIFARH